MNENQLSVVEYNSLVMDTIQEAFGKIKRFLDSGVGEWAVPVIILLVGLSSFGLGRLSAASEARPAVSVLQAASAAESREITVGGTVVASRSGGSYHFPWCAGAKTIKESNKVWFKDEAAAQKAGYTAAKNCEGLQ